MDEAAERTEVEGVEGNVKKDAEENGIPHAELFNEPPPREEQIKKMRKDIFDASRHQQADKEKAAAFVKNNWDVYSEHVARHIHRIPREGVENLAKEIGVDKKVFEACAGKYFAQVVETCSLEVLRMFTQQKGFKDEKLNEKDGHEINIYYNKLEGLLWMAMQVISLIKNESFSEICSGLDISEGTLKNLVNLFIAFRKSVLEKTSITTVNA